MLAIHSVGLSGRHAFAQSNMKTPSATVHPHMQDQFDRWRREIKKALFIDEPLPPVAPKHYGAFSPDEGVIAERVTYATSYGTTGIFETYWFPGAGHRPNFVTRPAVLWLQSQLHFPNWNETKIQSLGEVHIGEWAANTGAHIGHTFQNELSEGGVHALTTNVPNIPRNDLQAVPIDEWQKHKDDYVWKSWVTRAHAGSQ